MAIRVIVRSVYGLKRCYPACPKAELLLSLTGRKTFMPAELQAIRLLGYKIEYESEVL